MRQVVHRARQHVEARRPRSTVSPAEVRTALASFQRALETANLQGLLDVLSPDVVLLSDGGGLRQAALRPIVGADKVVRFSVGIMAKAGGVTTGEVVLINGNPALLMQVDGEIDGVPPLRVKDARITGVYYVGNPEKLTRVGTATGLTSR